MANQEPFAPQVNTLARAGRSTIAPERPYTGGWAVVEAAAKGLSVFEKSLAEELQDSLSARETLKRQEQAAAAQYERSSQEAYNKLTADQLAELNRAAQAKGQNAGAYWDSLYLSKYTTDPFVRATITHNISTQHTNWRASVDAQAINQRELQEQVDTQVVTHMQNNHIDIKNSDGSTDRAATLKYAKQLMTEAQKFKDQDAFWASLPFTRDMYARGTDEEKNYYDNVIVAEISKNAVVSSVDAKLHQLIQIAQSPSMDLQSFNNAVTSFKNDILIGHRFIDSASISSNAKTIIKGRFDKMLAAAQDVKNYSQAVALTQEVQRQRDELALLGLQDQSAFGDLERAHLAYPNAMKNEAVVWSGAAAKKVRAASSIPSIKPNVLKNKAYVANAYTSGFAVQGTSPQAQADNYSTIANGNSMVETDPTVPEDEKKQFTETSWQSIGNSWAESANNPKNPQLVSRTTGDALEYWSDEKKAERMKQLPADVKSLLIANGARLIQRAVDSTLRRQLQNPDTKKAIVFDEETGKFTVKMSSDLAKIEIFGKEVPATAVPVIGGAVLATRGYQLYDTISTLNKSLDAMVNIYNAAYNTPKSERAALAKQMTEQYFSWD